MTFIRQPSPSPAYPGVKQFVPSNTARLALRIKYRPIRDDGRRDELRLWIWSQLLHLWNSPIARVIDLATGQPRSGPYPKDHRREVAALLGLSSERAYKSLHYARLHEPQLPEAWWASYSLLARSLGNSCRRKPGKAAGLVQINLTGTKNAHASLVSTAWGQYVVTEEGSLLRSANQAGYASARPEEGAGRPEVSGGPPPVFGREGGRGESHEPPRGGATDRSSGKPPFGELSAICTQSAAEFTVSDTPDGSPGGAGDNPISPAHLSDTPVGNPDFPGQLQVNGLDAGNARDAGGELPNPIRSSHG